MRILVITPYFYPHPGGSQLYIDQLLGALRKKYPSIKVDVLCYQTDPSLREEKYHGFHIYRIPAWEVLPGQFAIPNYWSLVQTIRQLKRKNGPYTVVNAHTRFFESSWWAPLVARFLNAKPILTDHCASTPFHQFFVVRALAAVVDKVMVPFLSRWYTSITVGSQATNTYLTKRGAKPSTVIYPGVNNTLKPKLPTSLRDIPKNALVISFVGRMITAKGVQTFLAAVLPLLPQHPKVHVVLAGSGPLLTEVQLLTKNQPRIHVLGSISPSEVMGVLKSTDIFVHPSTHHEGIPLVLLEAAAAGCAVATTSQGGTGEVFNANKSGLIIKPNQSSLQRALRKLINNPQLRTTLGANAKKKSRQFQWSISAEQFLAVIRSSMSAS